MLTAELAALGAELMVQVIANLPAHPAVPQPDNGVTYAAKIMKDEARIDWNLAAVQVERMVRAFAPVPGAWFDLAGERVKLLRAEVMPPAAIGGPPGTVLDDALTIACNPGAIRPVLVQRAGRAVMKVAEMLRGFGVAAGTRLT
jgi:methionyl-tRNA formyltransferase